MPHRALYTIFL